MFFSNGTVKKLKITGKPLGKIILEEFIESARGK